MSSTTSAKPTLAFFGATGGCANAALAFALKDGYTCSALARTPKKLRDMLQNNHQVPVETIDGSLTIIEGSVDSIPTLKQVLAPNNVPASLIISGLGATPEFSFSRQPLKIDQPYLCGTASANIITALRELQREGIISASQKPRICALSSTGIAKVRDVPYVLYPIYAMLKTPHADKVAQEKNVVAATQSGSSNDTAFTSFTIVRPMLLVDGASKGLEAVRSGWVPHDDAPELAQGTASKIPLGNTIRRNDVGLWIFANFIKNSEEWRNRCVVLTY